MDHAREFMLRLTQTPIPLVIVCMRAKYTMEEKIKDGKKEWVRSTDLSPKQSEDILYEMFVHGWIDKEHKFHGTKYTLNILRNALIDGEPITVESGRRLAAWASGAQPSTSAAPQAAAPAHLPPLSAQDAESPEPAAADTPTISPDQVIALETALQDAGISIEKFKEKAGITRLIHLPAYDYDAAMASIARTSQKRRRTA
jgi:hypothetical protein